MQQYFYCDFDGLGCQHSFTHLVLDLRRDQIVYTDTWHISPNRELGHPTPRIVTHPRAARVTPTTPDTDHLRHEEQ